MTASVQTATPPRKPKAYFAQLNGTPGVLIKLGEQVVFLDTETDARTVITPANALQVLVLDEVSHWVDLYYADRAAMLAAKIAA